jgi:hypothetical protein
VGLVEGDLALFENAELPRGGGRGGLGRCFRSGGPAGEEAADAEDEEAGYEACE